MSAAVAAPQPSSQQQQQVRRRVRRAKATTNMKKKPSEDAADMATNSGAEADQDTMASSATQNRRRYGDEDVDNASPMLIPHEDVVPGVKKKKVTIALAAQWEEFLPC